MFFRYLSLLLLGGIFFFSCTMTPSARYASAPGGYGNSTSYRASSGALPSNPDPSKCYVRCVTLDVYSYHTDSVLTYTEEESLLYPHRTVEYELKPEVSRWESTQYEGCESDDPNDCQVLCYRTYPAETIVFYEPLDANVGEPYWDVFEVSSLERKGGLSSYEEIDCELTSFSILPVSYAKGSAGLNEEARALIDEVLLSLLRARENLRVQINVHTSSLGAASSNQQLSEFRARGVADYLVSQGINRQRLVTRGYGEAQLLNRCADGVNCSEEEHAVNQRLEWRVLNVDM